MCIFQCTQLSITWNIYMAISKDKQSKSFYTDSACISTRGRRGLKFDPTTGSQFQLALSSKISIRKNIFFQQMYLSKNLLSFCKMCTLNFRQQLQATVKMENGRRPLYYIDGNQLNTSSFKGEINQVSDFVTNPTWLHQTQCQF